MDVRAEWMNMFGTLLSRVVFDAEEETARVRTVAGVLAKTHWCFARDMETTPYIGGMPAGTSRPADVVWVDHVLYVGDLPKGRLARRVPEEIAKLFGRPDIKVALDYSFGRSPEDVGDYLEQNFEIQPVVNPEPEALPGTHSESAERHNTASGDKEKPVPEPHSECGVLPPVLQEEPPDEVTPSEMPGTSGNNEIIDSQAQDASLTSQLHPKSVPKAATPCLIERYASAQGFSGNGHDRFSRSDGTWIGRTAEGVFPWEQRTPSGDLMRMFWPRELCLEHEPLELPAEVWRLLELHPETYSLVLVNPIGQPAEISGVTLHTSLQAGRIKFYPAAYRIVQNNEPTS
jgi:hypothetical protein